MIRIAGLRVLYGAFAAVDGLDLDIRRGELFGLLGPNGAGKSTTIRVLIGQRRPSGGSVTRRRARRGPRMGRDQAASSATSRTARTTSRSSPAGGTWSSSASSTACPSCAPPKCLKMVELDEAADLPVRGYSLGMRKKLLLARALLHDPQVLYLDEPTANLDIHSAEVVHRILREPGEARRDGRPDHARHGRGGEDLRPRRRSCARGKLVALDSPLALKQQHTERKVDVIRDDGERFVFDMDDAAGRAGLAELVTAGRAASIRTREFDFHATFLKLTGLAFE